MSKSKNNQLTRQQQELAAKTFGKHVAPATALIAVISAVLLCLAPILMGLRYWELIPEIILTGLTDPSGNDDSLPRWALVYAIPGLMAVLTLICHGQLWFNQQRRTVPKPAIRLLGRWVIPVIAVFLSSWAVSSSAGQELEQSFKLLCAIGLLLVILGARLFEGKKDSILALNFGYARRSPIAWKKVQRLAGSCWLAAGLLLVIFLQLLGGLPLYAGAMILLLLIIPPVSCAVRH